jgi:hypothetical protein
VKVNNISLKQEGGQMTEQVEAQPQQQSVDPAVQQISDFISQAIEQGENPAEVVMTLVEQQVEQEIIGQALMMNGFEENDILSLFQQISQGQEEVSNEPGSPDDLNSNPQEISRNQSLEEEMQDPEMEMAKSGIEIKPENEGKFTRWAEARGMSVKEAASKVMANTNEYPPAIVKMANFAKNAAGWNKQDGGENYQMGGGPQGKVGVVNNVGVRNTGMNWQKAPLYINPMEYEYSNDNFSLGKAAAVAYGGYQEFLSGADKNEDGIKDGFFRDGNKKRVIRDATKGNYYNYKVTQDANDPNKYMADNIDLYNASKNQGSLRTADQYNKDVLDNSRFNYNVNTNNYDVITSSRPIDKRIYNSRSNKNALAGKDYNYLKEMTSDKDAREMIMGTLDDPEGTRLGIDAYGQASSYAPGANNPYEYNTYMGINRVGTNQNPMIPAGNIGKPAPRMFNTQPEKSSMMAAIPLSTPPNAVQKSFEDWYATGDYIRNQSKSPTQLKSDYKSYLIQGFKNGGDIMQFGGQPMSKNEWMNANGRGMIGQELMDENDYQTYLSTVNPATAPQNTQLAATFKPPTVDRTNNFEGGLNRFLDSPGVQGYLKASNFAVKGANVVNDWFRDKNVNKAREDNFNKLGADYQYATAEDPFNKRGMWDVNTGTAGSEGDRTTGLYMSKYGGENNTVNVNSNLLAKLIAAGADIEIL